MKKHTKFVIIFCLQQRNAKQRDYKEININKINDTKRCKQFDSQIKIYIYNEI